MDYRPLVSIIIPVYNGSNYVKEAIDSALSQTYESVEVIVVNDGSRDEGATEKIALSYGDKIRYIYKENGGVSSALNVGIRNMHGEYFSWLSHDDLYKPDKIETQIRLLCENGHENSVVLCEAEHINAKGELIKAGARKKELTIGRNEWSRALTSLCRRGSYNGCAFLIPKAALDMAGPFDESLKFSQDAFMWLRILLCKFDLIYTDRVCVSNRVHNAQLTQRGRDIYYKDRYYISREIIPALISQGEHARTLLYAYASYHARMNCRNVLKDCLREGKQKRLIPLGKRIKLRFISLYGRVRPLVRRIYYKLFRKMKTK